MLWDTKLDVDNMPHQYGILSYWKALVKLRMAGKQAEGKVILTQRITRYQGEAIATYKLQVIMRLQYFSS